LFIVSTVDSLAKLLQVLLAEGNNSIAEVRLQEDGEGKLSYASLLATVADCPSVAEMFPTYASTTAGYFRASRPSARANAVRLVSALLATMSPEAACEVNAGLVSGSLATLMAGDRTRTVQEAVAANIGDIFVNLSKAHRLKD
jgi:hypothetical protein